MNKRNSVIGLLCLVLWFAQGHAASFGLADLIDKAVAYHPSVKSSLSLEASAEQDVDAARWQYFPTPELSVRQVDTSQTDSLFSGDERVSILSFTQPLWAGGRIDAGLARSKAQLDAARSVVQGSQRDLADNVISAYSRWSASYLQYQAFRRSYNEHNTLKERIKRRIEQGLSSDSDLYLVTSRLNQVEFSLNAAQSGHESDLLNLSELVGESLSREDLLSDLSGNYLSFGDQALLTETALSINPRLKQLLAEQQVAKAAIQQARAQLSPELRLRLERQWGNFTQRSAPAESRVFVELVSSFGAGLSNFSAVRAARSQHQAATLAWQSERDRLERELKVDWLLNKSLLKQSQHLDASIAQAKQIQQSWYRQFLAGRKDWQDVMNAVREVTQLEFQAADVSAEQLLISWRLAIRVYGIKQLVQLQSLADDQPVKIPGTTTIQSQTAL